MFQNKRKYRRYPIFAKVEIKTKNVINPTAVIAHVNCISEVGLGVYSAKPVEARAKVSIIIEFLSFEGKKEKDSIECVVAWAITEDNSYYLGLLFDEELNKDKQPNLYRHFHRIVKND